MSQYSIPFEMTQVAQVVVAAIDASATVTSGTNLASSLFAGIVVTQKGAPFQVLTITKSNYQDVLGVPIKPSVGSCFEPMRHVYEALQQTDGYVVRVVPADAKRPVIYFSADSAGKITATYGAVAFDADIELDSDQFLAIYVYDGDPCNTTTRAITFTANSSDSSLFDLKLTQTTTLGVTTTLQTITVGFDEDDVDDMGRVAYVEDALEARSSYLRAVCDADAAQAAGFTAMSAMTFTGGTNGNQNNISTAMYEKAIKVLNNADVNFTAVCGFGVYDSSLITELADICNDRRIDGFFDLKPSLTYAEALEAAAALEIYSTDYTSCCLYHLPYTCKDKWTTSKVSFGLSGCAYAAKAKGVKQVADVGGWHYSPAGEDRGIINRASLKPIDPTDTPDYEKMVTYRINKVSAASNGQLMIDDALTTYSANNYLRFQHVASTMNAISRYYYSVARTLKHQPDGITKTRLTKEMTKIMERFEASGALVTPRDTDSDGTSPYQLTMTQVEFDYWQLSYACCVTGTSRRIMGVPSLIK
jgi:hypothetical protein